jgi:phosphopantetheinyl transferase
MKAIDKFMQYIENIILNKRSFKVNNSLSNGYLVTQLTRNADLGVDILMEILENCPDLSPE